MNTRQKFSAGLIFMGLILAFLPLPANLTLTVKPSKLLTEIADPKVCFTADQVAKFIVTEDSTVRIIDVRSPEEFRKMNIPRSVNVPYSELLDKGPAAFIDTEKSKNIFYSNDDFDSNYALTVSRGMNFKNTYVMQGGLNEWFRTVMNSRFTGEKLSVKENALFETRIRARNLFNEINSLPDSLKMKYFVAKHASAKKLDGGCE